MHLLSFKKLYLKFLIVYKKFKIITMFNKTVLINFVAKSFKRYSLCQAYLSCIKIINN